MTHQYSLRRYERPHPLSGARMKLRRANEHLKALDQSVKGFLRRNPYELAVQFEPEEGADIVVVWARVRESPPLEWSLVIGDIVHNLRSAHDHLAYQLVVVNGKKPTVRTAFPIRIEDPYTSKDPRALKGWERMTRGMHARDIVRLEELQPYQGGDDRRRSSLYVLNRLSNWDKHNELNFTGHSLEHSNINIDIRDYESELLEDNSFGLFEHGAVVARYRLIPTGPDPQVNVQAQFAFGVSFGEGGASRRTADPRSAHTA
jgi:hypothetical protein